MKQEEKELLLKDLCARLCYGVILHDEYCKKDYKLISLDANGFINYDLANSITHIKPYLRPMSSMTEEEAMKVAELWGFKDILSISVKENYISVELDDGVAGSETYTIWFKEMVSSIELFDWLNSHYFDYRGLIPRGLALEAPEDMYKVK